MFAPMLECTLRASTVNLAGGPDLLAKACPGCPEIVVSCSSCSTTAFQNEDKKHRGATDGDECCEGCVCVCLCVFVRVGNERLALLLFSEPRALLQVLDAWSSGSTQLSSPRSKSHARTHGYTHVHTHTCHFCRVSGTTTQQECRAILKRWTAQAL